jgi:hypothetical protein
MAIITGSPVVCRDVVYVGISSNEEILAIPNSYQCCTFRGSVVVVDANTGKVLLEDLHGAAQRSTAVGPAGIFGGIEWGTATDCKRVYVAISNSFHVPTKLINSQTTANGGFRKPSMRLPERSFGRLRIRTMPPTMARSARRTA